jgi:hypothetical protein
VSATDAPPAAAQAARFHCYGLALALALAAVGILDVFTNSMPKPLYDGAFYVQMSITGLDDSRHLAAPFAYRPAVPMLVRLVCDWTSLPVLTGYAIVTRVAAVIQLFLAFALAVSFGAGLRGSLAAMGAAALSLFHVKYPLYFFTLVDVEGYCFAVLATWALVRRRYAACVAASCAGLFFKEFLIIPPLLVMLALFLEHRRDPARSGLSRVAAAMLWVAVPTALCFLAPRILIPVRLSYQFFDPVHHPETWTRLFTIPLDFARSLNIPYSFASYWLPTLLLVTPRRARRVWQELVEIRWLLVLYLLFTALLCLYGGTNIMIFAAYALPLQVIALARLCRGETSGAEIVFMLAAVAVFNRALLPIPELGHDPAILHRHMDFYGGWSSRVSWATALRTAELATYVAAAAGLRLALSRRRRRGESSASTD